MSRVKSISSEKELERIGGEVVAEVVRDQMHGTVSALREKLARAKAASAKAKGADSAAMAKYLGVRADRKTDTDD
jgi:predicted PP-loop superfamily ATPase